MAGTGRIYQRGQIYYIAYRCPWTGVKCRSPSWSVGSGRRHAEDGRCRAVWAVRWGAAVGGGRWVR